MECHWSKQIWFASSLDVVFNPHDSSHVPFSEWLEINIINATEDVIVHVLALSYEIWCARNKKCFEGTDVNVAAIVQKAQRSIVNFKSASTVLLETLSGGPTLPISDVHWTPPFYGFYKLYVDAAGPIEGSKWGIGVVVRDNEGVVVGASCWQVFSLSDSEVAEALAMRKCLKFAKDMSFLNLIVESNASKAVSAFNAHQQSPTYVGSIIRDCISFKDCFRRLNFLHVRREANQAAHYLAKHALHNLD
jgi:ribonuclease HI